MKIAVECHSPLLQKSLELFLEKYITLQSRANIVVSDRKNREDDRYFYIGTDSEADLMKPFSKAQLILALEKRYESLNISQQSSELEAEESLSSVAENMDFTILEKRIESLTQEYQANIIRAVKAFYEK